MKPANCQNPTNRLYLRLLHFRVRFRQNPDEFVEYGGYEMRRRDRMQVERGFTTRAVIRLSDGELTGARLWKEKPEDTGYNVSWDDPRVAKEQHEQEKQQQDNTLRRPPAVNRTPPPPRTVPPKRTVSTPTKGPKIRR